MADIVGPIVAILTTPIMLFLLWRYGIAGLWEIQRNAIEKVWLRAIHGRPRRVANPRRIAELERELLGVESGHDPG